MRGSLKKNNIIKITKIPSRRFRLDSLSDHYRADKAAGLIYLVLICLLTWPLVTHLNSLVPGVGNDMGDTFQFLWDMWWVKRAMLDGLNLFHTDYLFYPNGASLVYHTLITGQSILSVPWQSVLPLVAIFNGFYLLFFWLSAMFTFWLARLYWKNDWAAFVAGLIFAFSPYFFAHSLGHFNLTAIWVFPATIYMIKKHDLTNHLWWLVGAAMIVSFTLLNDYQYFIFLVLLIALYYLYEIITSRNLINGIVRLVLIGSVVFLIGFPVIWYGLSTVQNYLPSALLSEVNYWSADLISFFVPSWLHPFWGGVAEYYALAGLKQNVESVVYVGWTVIGLMVAGIIIGTDTGDKKNIRFWQISLIIFGLLALGPFLKIFGQSEFAISDMKFNVVLPYIIFFKIPMMTIARVPARFYVLLSLSLALLAAYVLQRMLRWFDGWTGIWSFSWKLVLTIFFSVLILTEYIALPFRLQEVSIPPVYAQIKMDPEQFTLLELPLWWTSGHRVEGNPVTIIEYYQTFHEKRILNGSVSRVPDALFDYYLDFPGIKYLINVEQLPDSSDLDKNLVIDRWQKDLGIKYIVIHKKYFTADEFWRIKNYLENNLGLESVYDDEGEVLYNLTVGN